MMQTRGLAHIFLFCFILTFLEETRDTSKFSEVYLHVFTDIHKRNYLVDKNVLLAAHLPYQ